MMSSAAMLVRCTRRSLMNAKAFVTFLMAETIDVSSCYDRVFPRDLTSAFWTRIRGLATYRPREQSPMISCVE